MDRRPERKAKRAREEEDEVVGGGGGHAAVFPFEAASRRPPGVFQFPWQKCRCGLGVASGAGGAGWELRDVFFRSLVNGGAAAIGVPGDRLVSPPPSKQALLEGVEAWLAAAADDGEVDPVWRSALKGGPRPGPTSSAEEWTRPSPAFARVAASVVSPAWHSVRSGAPSSAT